MMQNRLGPQGCYPRLNRPFTLYIRHGCHHFNLAMKEKVKKAIKEQRIEFAQIHAGKFFYGTSTSTVMNSNS